MASVLLGAVGAQAPEDQLLRSLRVSEHGQREHAAGDRSRASARSLPTASSAASARTPRRSSPETGSTRSRSRPGPRAGIATSPSADGCRWLTSACAETPTVRPGVQASSEGTDMLIVPGTGLVTDAYGLVSWGPYSLFKWVLMAKLRRSRVLFISVGAGPIYGAAGRALVKAALSLADYRSYRDEASREYLSGIGFPAERDPVYPDLVFSLPQALLSDRRARSRGPQRVVGLGLMEYSGQVQRDRSEVRRPTRRIWSRWPSSRNGCSSTTTTSVCCSAMATRRRDRGVQARPAGSRLGSYDEERIIARPIASVQDMLAELARDRRRRRDPLPQRSPVAAAEQARDRDLVPPQVLVADAADEAVGVLPRHSSDRHRPADRAVPAAGARTGRGEAHDRRGRGRRRARRSTSSTTSCFQGVMMPHRSDASSRPASAPRFETAFLRHERADLAAPSGAACAIRGSVRAYGAWLHALVCRQRGPGDVPGHASFCEIVRRSN